jgi:hypothetical protein
MRDIIASPSQISTSPSSGGQQKWWLTTKEALMTENGQNNPNIQDGGNAIRYMACLSQKGGSPTSRIGVR